MEDNKEKDLINASDFQEDFKDFDDFEEENSLPEIDEDLANAELEENEFIEEVVAEEPVQESSEVVAKESLQVSDEEPIQEEVQPKQELSPWEELDENNSVVKKYIFYVSKDFVPYIDKLTTDERSAYINDAIQKKIDLEDEQKQKDLKKKLTTHFVLMCLTMCLFAPVALFVAHKAIMATFDNYKYSQENFEKLYKDRFLKDRAYMRSIQYNKEQEMKKKK